MSVALAEEPRLLHAVPGRVRVHVPGWTGKGRLDLESRLRRLDGVIGVRANPVTSNVVVAFDRAVTDAGALLAALQSLASQVGTETDAEPPAPHVLHERAGPVMRARITVRGLDRNPGLAGKIVERLRERPGVLRVVASPLTGRVLVEYTQHLTVLEDLAADISQVELPEIAGEDQPAHPLDPAPLIQNLVRTIGSGLGLAFLAFQHATGFREPPGLRVAAGRVAAGIGIVMGFPFVRSGLRRLLGRNAADLALYGPTILVLTLAGSPLGLAVTAMESARLLTEILARRAAWRRYEENLPTAADAHPGAVIRVESGDRSPLPAVVMEGYGTAIGPEALPMAVAPGERIPAGSRLFGGPFVLSLAGLEPFVPRARPEPPAPSLYDRYIRALGPASLGYAALTAILTRSFSRAFQALILVNPRTAIIAKEAADTGASAHALRSGVIVVGTREGRIIRLPTVLLIDGPRVLADGFEIAAVMPLDDSFDASEVTVRATSVAAAAGSPWGGAFGPGGRAPADAGRFDGREASAEMGGVRFRLGPTGDDVPAAVVERFRESYLLVLRGEGHPRPLGVVALRPRLASGVNDLVERCRRYGVSLRMVAADDSAGAELARRTGVEITRASALDTIEALQQQGAVVAFVADSARGAELDACDLAIGLTSGRGARFPARADLLAPDLASLCAILDAGARRERATRDSVLLSAASNLFGAVWGLRGEPGVLRASYGVYVSALAAMVDGWVRLRGGERSRSSITRLVDPRPERWGRRSIEDALRALNTSENGLTHEEAARRRQSAQPRRARNGLLGPLLAQLRSPLTGILAAGAGLSFLLGATADVFMIGATIAANVAVGVWQERQTGQAIAALERMESAQATVRRNGEAMGVPVDEVVPGDILVLTAGERIAADGRIVSAQQLEVDEAALTGESLPVAKDATGGSDATRVVLAGSDVTVGSGLAVVTAVGSRTRMGATAAALAVDETSASPLGIRLNRMLQQVLPLAAAGGLVVLASGLLRRRPVLSQAGIAASIAIAAVPEGLPLLAGVGEAAVARRLARRSALVRRLSAIEAMGRVDVACTDKTGTLTEGRLAVTSVATLEGEGSPERDLAGDFRRVLLTAGLATPHPDAPDAAAHPTDIAVMEGATSAGLDEELRAERVAELPFDPVRSFHVAVVGHRLCTKGAVEALVPRCTTVLREGQNAPIDDAGRERLLARAQELAGRGLRVLMVAEGSADEPIDNPQGLVALGFVGISDPLRPEVRSAVSRCHDAGIRVVMITGDHPATATAIAQGAGILRSGDTLITGEDIAELQNGELDKRLERAAVIARVTPLDKVRIVESFQRLGHTVAMTGDGVNDGPALRLADVGVAMGQHGTEVARHAADVVLADDDFSTLVEALVEGRSFWRNIRRALGLLLGGNLGELGLVVGASAFGLASPLLTRQILAVNLVTDVLPSLAVALQPPEHRNLAGLDREGTAALDRPLRADVRRRGIATAVPSLLAYMTSLRTGGLEQARSVAFASVVATQLAQTLDAGRTEKALTRSVLGAVVGSAGVLIGALTLPPLRQFLSLAVPSPVSWGLILATALIAPLLGRGLRATRLNLPAVRPLPSLAASPAT